MLIKKLVEKIIPNKKPQTDCIDVKFNELTIKMSRITDPEIPHEVTVVIPRAEIREKYDSDRNLVEREVILSSITVVHAPRHPLAGPPSPPPEIPAISKNFLPKS